ncbi:putative phospholipase B-like 2 [Orchesella cincta]|uniref:Phospholipase B-like n=1 Tax=Orchesella cincta TaxID=48709 RepID=A0A1D2MQK2_ORCCI|nr:putative phospholipase B-like 2 [Orchesella cincta]
MSLKTVAVILGICYLSITVDAIRYKESRSFKKPPHLHSKFAYVTWTKEKGYDIKIFAAHLSAPNGLDWIAKARYQNLVNKTGWAFVEVESKPSWPDEMQAYAAGIAEGYLTKDLIYYSYKNTLENYCDDKPKTCQYIDKFVSQNMAWTLKSVKALKNQNSYWYQVNLLIQQIDGLYFGYKKASNGTESDKLTKKDLIYLNIREELDDLSHALDPTPGLKDPTDREGHCSVMIKVMENNRDIFSSHVTWTKYTSMLRVIKRYNLAYRLSSSDKNPVPATEISFSSYPGVLQSIDDWYITSSGLMVTETTNENYNDDLWKKLSPKTLFSGLRAVVATRLATDGKSWTTIFSRYNSGTYNNQWMVVDYDLFEPTKPLGDGVLWVLEQLPGITVAKDMTSVLRNQGYWASYNIPYFDEIYQTSGHQKMVDQYGDFFSYNNNARAQIFARDHVNAKDVDSTIELMRYNDFQNEPLSRCNCTPPYSAENSISSRNDLNPSNGTYPIKMLGHRPSGATDLKLTNLDLLLLQQFVSIAGPTYDPLPPFRWSTSDFKNLPHYGQPDLFAFEPLIHQWHWL